MRMTLLTVFLFLSTVSPRTAENKTTKEPKTNTQNEQTSPCLLPPFAVKSSTNGNQNQCEKKASDEQRRLVEITPSPLIVETKKSRWEEAQVIATICLVLVGILQIWLLLETVVATRDNAEAAKLSARAVLDSERAWVEIGLGPPREDTSDNADDSYGSYTIRIINRGRTIARVEKYEFGVNAASGAWDLEGFSKVTKKFNVLLGNSNKRTVVTTINIPNQFSDWRSIQKETKKGFIRIAVFYQDVLQRTITHESSAIYTWNVWEEQPEREELYNVYT
jgi:hypothetical protein